MVQDIRLVSGRGRKERGRKEMLLRLSQVWRAVNLALSPGHLLEVRLERSEQLKCIVLLDFLEPVFHEFCLNPLLEGLRRTKGSWREKVARIWGK